MKFIFTFILFVAFSMVNAVPHLLKRGTEFSPCTLKDGAKPDPLSVTIQSDPVSGKPGDFKVSGTVDQDIIAGETILGIGYYDPTAKKLLGNPYTQNFTKSVSHGNSFSVEATNVPTPKLPSSKYYLAVILGRPIGGTSVSSKVFGCAFALFHGSETSAYFDDTINDIKWP